LKKPTSSLSSLTSTIWRCVFSRRKRTSSVALEPTMMGWDAMEVLRTSARSWKEESCPAMRKIVLRS
jgi:hypothetical protein